LVDPDLALVLGLIVAGLSVISILSALADRRSVSVSMVPVTVSAGLIGWALWASPSGYRIADVDDVFYSVVARFIP
jgi:hypothetical protein